MSKQVFGIDIYADKEMTCHIHSTTIERDAKVDDDFSVSDIEHEVGDKAVVIADKLFGQDWVCINIKSSSFQFGSEQRWRSQGKILSK
jgi:negative regulator of sigma E activity